MFRELCGDTTLKNVILATTMWGEVSPDVGESREKELSTNFFKSAIDKGARMARHHNTKESAHGIIKMVMERPPAVLQIQRELVNEHKEITQTSAGEIINRELNELTRKHEASLKEMQEEMEQALRRKDEETRKELEEREQELQEEMKRTKEDSEGMASKYAEEKRRMEARAKEIVQEAKGDRERLEAEYNRKMDELKRRLQDTASASGDERAALEQQIENLERLRDEAKESWCC